jgi:nitrous oxidase accessory protein
MMMRPRADRAVRLALAILCVGAGARTSHAQGSRALVVVSPDGPIRRVGDAVRIVASGGRIVVRAGVYREPTIVVDRPLAIEGDGDAVLDGEDARQIMTVKADDVTIRRLHFRRVGVAMTEDRAAIRVQDASRCAIEDNRIDDAFFGIYLANVTGCRVVRNVLRATKATEAASGNGIHLWTSRDVTIEDNRVSGHRDGIYFEFVHATDVRRNLSEGNLRYGLHFMYSDDCRYRDNVFRRNGAGVAVMYTKQVEMTGNRFEDNWGSAAYGLLLKEISDPVIVGNRFVRNTVGLVADGAMRLDARDNAFLDNGWAVRLMGSTVDGRFARNEFVGNSFDVATNSRQPGSAFDGNYWDAYRGYDLDRDGRGDVPHHPVRLFSYLVAQNEPSLILLRSLFVEVLDAAERVLPALTPETLVDPHPAMRRFQ